MSTMKPFNRDEDGALDECALKLTALPEASTHVVFAENSTGGGCHEGHADLALMNDEGIVIMCVHCGKRWTPVATPGHRIEGSKAVSG